MKRASTHLSLVVALSLASSAFALPSLDVQETDNGDGTYSWLVNIESLDEISFLELTITGSLNQVQSLEPLYTQFGPDWAPNVVFASEQALAEALDATYAASSDQDTVIDDTWWPGKVSVELVPNDGTPEDGTQMVHVALASFTGGIGGPLPGGLIPLFEATTTSRDLAFYGVLQSESDQDGSFGFILLGDRSWINPTGGAFETNSNWNPAAFPTAVDNAIFDLDDQYTVTFVGDAETAGISVFTDDVTWDLNTHTYTLSDVTVLGEVSGDSGHLTVTDGTVEGRTVSIGREAGSDGSLTVSTGGVWNHPSSTMVVGRDGSGALTVEDGGTVSSTMGEVARDDGAVGTATVDGAMSSWTVANDLFVGQGGDGDLTVSGGGTVSADAVTAGENSTGLATIEVTGADSLLDVTARLAVGGDGTGSLSVLAGGRVESDITDAGFATGGSGTITVSGTDSSLSVDDLLQIGRDGQGQLTISNGGTVTSLFKARLGVLEGSSGNATITGAGSTLDVADFFAVGSNGTGNLTISGGGTVIDLVTHIGQNATATGSAIVTGAGSTWTQVDRVEVGSYGDGNLDINSGGTVISANGFIGRYVGSTGEATISGAGSAWNMTGILLVGGDVGAAGGEASLSISDGGKADVSDTVVVWQPGTIELDGGEVEALTATNYGTLTGNGTWDVNNTTNHGTIAPGLSAGKITFDGALDLGATSTVEIEINGSTADTEYDVLEIVGAATLDGTLAVTVDAGFTPDEGEAFAVVTYASHGSSEFDDITGFLLPDGRALIADYDSTELRLVASYFGDGNLDGVVDGLDYLLWAGNYGDDPADDPPGAPQNGDYNNDGLVDGLDYLVWAGNYGEGVVLATPVPEPASWLLAVLGLAAFITHRRVPTR